MSFLKIFLVFFPRKSVIVIFWYGKKENSGGLPFWKTVYKVNWRVMDFKITVTNLRHSQRYVTWHIDDIYPCKVNFVWNTELWPQSRQHNIFFPFPFSHLLLRPAFLHVLLLFFFPSLSFFSFQKRTMYAPWYHQHQWGNFFLIFFFFFYYFIIILTRMSAFINHTYLFVWRLKTWRAFLAKKYRVRAQALRALPFASYK